MLVVGLPQKRHGIPNRGAKHSGENFVGQIGSAAFLAARPSVERIDQSFERLLIRRWKEIGEKSKFPEESPKIPVVPVGKRIPVWELNTGTQPILHEPGKGGRIPSPLQSLQYQNDENVSVLPVFRRSYDGMYTGFRLGDF